MSSDNSLDRLLTVKDIYSLYVSLGASRHTDIDIENSPFDLAAARNSIALLISIGLVGIRFGKYNKKDKSRYLESSAFKNELLTGIHRQYAAEIKSMFSGMLHYDESRSTYYIKRNSIDLNLSGLLMLLDGLGALEVGRTDVFIRDNTFIEGYMTPKQRNRRITLMQLKEGLAIKDAIGEEAEKLALELEKSLLLKMSINKTPSIISTIDVSAGYDIVSFLNKESTVADKFIEVKSCPDHSYRFYVSKNEIESARNKGSSYFLYLYNRASKNFRIIQNPYEKVFENDDWAKEPQILEVHSLD